MNNSGNKKTNNTLDMVKMGKHIAELRKRRGYTQKKLGEILDISDKTISKWELGLIAPDITLINALAIALDVTIEEILRGEDISDEQKFGNNQMIDLESSNYNNKKHNRIIIFIIFIITFLLFVFFIQNYNKWNLIKIEGRDSEFYISGYIFTNRNESKLIIDKIIYVNDDIGTNNNFYVSSIEIEVNYNKKTIYSKINDLSNENITLDSFLSNYIIIKDNNHSIDINDIVICVEYYEKDTNINHRNIIYFNDKK